MNVSITQAEGQAAVVAFGGISQGLGIPVFEFVRTLTGMGVACMFVKDPSQKWYSSVEGLGESPDQIAQTLSRLTKDHFPNRRILTLGNSMGGFAAILFASLCGFEKAVAFAPQTFISRELRRRYEDRRWAAQLDGLQHTYSDLSTLPIRPITVFVSPESRLDLIHAERIRARVCHVAGGHDAVKAMRDRGDLVSTLRAEFGLPPVSLGPSEETVA
jgi:hypothetical protein